VKKTLILSIIFFLSADFALAKQCTGRMINPLSDICWSCVFPISIGAFEVVPGETPDTENFPSPICICPAPPPQYERIGLAVGYWEPIRLIDVTKAPFCFVGLGGKTIGSNKKKGSGAAPGPGVGDGTELNKAFWHLHWYQYPVFMLIGEVMDDMCQEDTSGFDITYITEYDAMWQDDELSFIITPESILFGNLVAQAACAVDCLSATFWLPLDPLFWCAGCHGGMYPINGNIDHHIASVQSSSLAASRMIYKMHREVGMPITSGPDAICSAYSSFMIKKSQYRFQMTVPVATTDPRQGCNQLGRSTMLWDSFKEIPVSGEDFNYLLWRKRNCCVSE